MRLFNWAVLKGFAGKKENKERRRCERTDAGARMNREHVHRSVGLALTRERKANKETGKAGCRPKRTSANPLTFGSFPIKNADWLAGWRQLTETESLIGELIEKRVGLISLNVMPARLFNREAELELIDRGLD